jgi:hypothetical protein
MPNPKSIRTPADLYARCAVVPETGCLRWLGATSSHGTPSIWIPELGAPHGLQTVFHMLRTGTFKVPPGMAYVPTCKHLWCCNDDHRVLGTRSELFSIINGQMTEKRRAFYSARAALYASQRPAKQPKPARPSKVRDVIMRLIDDPEGVYAAKLTSAAKCAADHARRMLAETPGLIAAKKPALGGPDGMRVHYFRTQAQADAWLSIAVARNHATVTQTGRVRVQPAKPIALDGPVDASRARYTLCPSGTDYRFTVHGPVPRVVDSAQCSPWARAAAGD